MMRHGESEDNLLRVYSRFETPLSKKGTIETKKRRALLALFSFRKVLVSPMVRAKQSLACLGLEGEVEPALREIDFGAFGGLRFEKLLNDDPALVDRWMREGDRFRFPDGESIEDVYRRTDALLDTLVAQGENVLLVTHDHVIRCLLCTLLGNREDFYRFQIANSSVSVVRISGEHSRIRCLNLPHSPL